MMVRAEVLNERQAVASRSVVELQSSRIIAVDKNDAFKSRSNGGERGLREKSLGAPGDPDTFSIDTTTQALSWMLVDFRRGEQGKRSLLRRLLNRIRQRVFGISFDAGGEPKDFIFVDVRCRKNCRDRGLTEGECAGLVEDHG